MVTKITNQSASPENTGAKQAKKQPEQANKGQFKNGVSGNSAGKPQGARNRATLLAEQLMDGEAEVVVGNVIMLAKAGDLTALKLCIERILPPPRC